MTAHSKCKVEHCTAKNSNMVKSCEMITASQIAILIVLVVEWVLAIFTQVQAKGSGVNLIVFSEAATLLLCTLLYYSLGLWVIEESYYNVLQSLEKWRSVVELWLRLGIAVLLVVSINLLDSINGSADLKIYLFMIVMFLSLISWDIVVYSSKVQDAKSLVGSFIVLDLVALDLLLLIYIGSSIAQNYKWGAVLAGVATVVFLILIIVGFATSDNIKKYGRRIWQDGRSYIK